MSKRTASNVDEALLISNVHMRTKGSVPFQRQVSAGDNPCQEQEDVTDVQERESRDSGQAYASEPRTETVASHRRKDLTPKRLPVNPSDYDQFFLVRNEIKFRKAAYLSIVNHDAISRIVKELGNGQLSVGGYLDLIVTAHLEQYRDRINALYRARDTRDNLI